MVRSLTNPPPLTRSPFFPLAELYMTQDRSLDFVDTERFLHRRLAELDYLGTRMAHAGSWLDFTRHAFVNLLRSQGAPI